MESVAGKSEMNQNLHNPLVVPEPPATEVQPAPGGKDCCTDLAGHNSGTPNA